jgi:hypothetical protein
MRLKCQRLVGLIVGHPKALPNACVSTASDANMAYGMFESSYM